MCGAAETEDKRKGFHYKKPSAFVDCGGYTLVGKKRGITAARKCKFVGFASVSAPKNPVHPTKPKQWETGQRTVGKKCPTECGWQRHRNGAKQIGLWNAVYGEKRTCPEYRRKAEQLAGGSSFLPSPQRHSKDMYNGHIFCGIIPQRNKGEERWEQKEVRCLLPDHAVCLTYFRPGHRLSQIDRPLLGAGSDPLHLNQERGETLETAYPTPIPRPPSPFDQRVTCP